MLSLLIFVCCIICLKASTVQLIFTHVIYRHGERTPLATYPNDPYKEHVWPNGFGQLLPLGCQQQYELGTFLRKHYNGFLSPYYEKSEIYVRSTDKDRTLASAYCNLAGLYPPAGGQMWNPHIDWQPIPVHTVPQEEDSLLRPKTACKSRDELVKKEDKQLNSKLLTLYRNFFQFLESETGLKNFTQKHVGKLYGVLSRQRDFGFTLPLWVHSSHFDPLTGTKRYALDIMEDIHRVVTLAKFNSPSKVRFGAGTLVGSLVNTMRKKIKQTKPSHPTKMIMYSAHDTTLLALLNAFQMANNLLPPIASCVMVELYKDSRENHFVSVRYKNDTGPPYLLKSPKCVQHLCPFETFASSVEHVSFSATTERLKACRL